MKKLIKFIAFLVGVYALFETKGEWIMEKYHVYLKPTVDKLMGREEN